MSFISKITSRFTSAASNIAASVERPRRLPNRFLSEGPYQTMGAVTRAPRQNSSDELIKSIRAYADIYEKGAKSAEPRLIEFAQEYGVNLPKEAKRMGVDIFEAAKRKGRVEYDVKTSDIFTGEEKIERRSVDLAVVSDDVRAQKLQGETNSRELRNFLSQAGDMSPEHLGIAHDIIDLSHMGAMLNTNISLQKMLDNGRTIMGDLLSKFPEVSRKNPGAVELTGKVFNHSDDTNSKFFLCNLFGNDLANLGHLSEQMRAVRELVPTIAKRTLSGGYLMDYSKENAFFKMISDFCRADAKPENIRVIPKVLDIVEHAPGKGIHSIDGTEIAIANPKVVNENLGVLPEVLENAAYKDQALDVSAFLTKNVNLD